VPPPQTLVRALVDGPSLVSAVDWHDVAGSTNALAAAAAAGGGAEGHLVLADVQTAGRGRRGRAWSAPPGTSLLLSLVTRPRVAAADLPLLTLLTGLALAEAAGAGTALKWPNDLLAGGRKVAGILVEAAVPVPAAAGRAAAVVGVGVNVDWRGVDRPPALAGATSLAEVGGTADRWELLDAFVASFGARYRAWQDDPRAFLPAYRERSATIGARVRVGLRGDQVVGTATAVADDGALELRTDAGDPVRLLAGDVEHVRPSA